MATGMRESKFGFGIYSLERLWSYMHFSEYYLLLMCQIAHRLDNDTPTIPNYLTLIFHNTTLSGTKILIRQSDYLNGHIISQKNGFYFIWVPSQHM